MTTVENLEKELKQGNLKGIYLLYGEETFLLESCLKRIKSNFGDIIPGINYIKLDSTNVNNIVADMETPAFGYEKKLIIARDTGLFKKDGRKKVQANSEIVNKIVTYIEENIDIINESMVIVFVEEAADKNELYNACEKYGVICNFQELNPMQITARIKAIAKAYKVQMDDYVIKYLIDCIGCNMQDLINESRKLIEYAGEGGTVKKEDIDLLCIKKIDSIIFDLTDNLGKKNTKAAMEVLNNLILTKEPVQKILITLYGHFKKLYIVKLCEKYNKNINESLKLKPNQTFLVSKYRTQAGYFKEQELKNIIQELIDLDTNYKIGLIDLNIGLEAILCRYC